jgi:eukaryotic-like serine/threonine-protein kinase
MSSAFDQTTFAATTMDTQSGEGDVASYGYLGRYRLDRMIGHGAMGAVFEAFDATLGRTIAIKTLYTQTDASQGGFDSAMVDAAILQEARAAATLNHPHIVTVYDAGRAPSSMLGRELPYVAMELLQGIDLRQRIIDGPPMAQREAVALVGKLALALDHAHKAGVLHRDIKPANVFMSKTNGPKILDFGLAKFTARATLAAQLGNTASSSVVAGSPQYMSPEMVLSVNDPSVVVDQRSDVFSLGVMLYELLCGKQPFNASTIEMLQQRIVKSAPEAPHIVNPAIPRELSDIVLNALDKKPEDRYRSAAQLARELRRWGAGPSLGAEAKGATETDAELPPSRPMAYANTSSAKTGLKNAKPDDQSALQRESHALQAALIANSALTASTASRAPLMWAGLAGVVAIISALFIWQATSKSTLPARPASASVPAVVKAPAPIIDEVAEPATKSAAGATQVAVPVAAPVAGPVAGPATTPVAAVPTGQAPLVATNSAAGTQPAAATAPDAAAATPAANSAVTPAAASTALAPAQAASAPTTGRVRIAVLPWGEIEVDGKKMGVSPPLTSLTLEPGEHTVVLRNTDFAARTVRLKIEAGKTDKISHKFE